MESLCHHPSRTLLVDHGGTSGSKDIQEKQDQTTGKACFSHSACLHLALIWRLSSVPSAIYWQFLHLNEALPKFANDNIVDHCNIVPIFACWWLGVLVPPLDPVHPQHESLDPFWPLWSWWTIESIDRYWQHIFRVAMMTRLRVQGHRGLRKAAGLSLCLTLISASWVASRHHCVFRIFSFFSTFSLPCVSAVRETVWAWAMMHFSSLTQIPLQLIGRAVYSCQCCGSDGCHRGCNR